MLAHEQASLIDILAWRAKNQPDRLAYRFLVDGEFDEVVLTYEELDRRARSIGALLQSSVRAGDRALLLFPPGLDFISAYFGCLYAKVIAIPAYPPHPARFDKTTPAILRIVEDAKPAAALLTRSLFDAIESQNVTRAGLGNMKLLIMDNSEMETWNEKWRKPEIGGNDIAFLQYTSGSTAMPRGVMISHSNLLHNLESIARSFGQSGNSHAVIWLPPYHDMGLVGGILQPLYSGYPVTLMAHMMFLQRPYRWLQAISRFHSTTSGGPNFAYDLCVKKIKPEQRALLDLRSWEVAFNGAEPVYHKTLEQFAEYFAPCGFRPEAFLPCYGLAESTLMVTGGPKFRSLDKQKLTDVDPERDHGTMSSETKKVTRIFVGCGKNLCENQEIRIVNAEELTPCPAGEIGEIWIKGPSVSSGYWNKPGETELTFGARLSSNGEGPFLRSGDLGFLKDGELYIAGRIKNLVISSGKSHYSYDLERTAESAHPAIWPGGCAVFSIGDDGPESVIVVAEVKYKLFTDSEEVIRAIRHAISEYHALHIDDVRLIPRGGLPRTASGKTRHFLCRQHYLDRTLQEISST